MTKKPRARIPRDAYRRIVGNRKSSEGVKSPSERGTVYRRDEHTAPARAGRDE